MNSATSAPAAVTTTGIVRQYGDTVALAGVDLEVPTGATYGLVGPNGAGKSTLLEILAGLRTPTSGRVEIAAPRHRVAMLPDTPRWDPWLTAYEVVDLARALVAPNLGTDAVHHALSTAGLADAADRRCGGFSRGMLQRLGIASTLVGDPELVLLDEPSSALDPVGRREVLDLVVALRGAATVIFSSHILGDVQEVCSHVGVLNKGHLVAQGPTADLLAGRAAAAMQVVLESAEDAIAVHERLERSAWASSTERDGTHVTVAADDLDTVRRHLPAALADAQVPVVATMPVEVTLEQVFLEWTR